ncbi:MAG: EamA family transporter [Actinomycetota bacterium]|nr:EamA family transporter [Actinomycetota bacterium]
MLTDPAAGPARRPASTARVWTALAIVYVFWGSTYLAIRVVVETMPPFLSAGARFLAAAGLLGTVLIMRVGVKAFRVTRRQLAGAALVGLLLPLGGNGLVVWGEQTVRSGLAALLVAAVPLWVVLLRSATGDRPRLPTLAGVCVGFTGLAVLVIPGGGATGPATVGVLVILLGSLSWAVGSFASPRLPLPANPFVATAYEMLAGGAGLVLLGLATGEGRDLRPAEWSAASWAALIYLVLFGSLLAYTAYVWLLGSAPISLVSTYAYVNPVVAVLLGALVLSEPLSWGTLIGGGIVVAGVALVVSTERPRRRQRRVAATTVPGR